MKYTFAFMILVVVLIMTACGGKTAANGNTQSEAPAEEHVSDPTITPADDPQASEDTVPPPETVVGEADTSDPPAAAADTSDDSDGAWYQTLLANAQLNIGNNTRLKAL